MKFISCPLYIVKKRIDQFGIYLWRIFSDIRKKIFKITIWVLPQNGIPSGDHTPFSQTLREGPNNSKPLSQEYEAIVPSVKFALENTTVLCAGEPGKLHFEKSVKEKLKHKCMDIKRIQ